VAFSTEWRTVENYNGYGGTWRVLGMSEIAFRVEDDGTYSSLFLAAASPQGGVSSAVSNYPAFQRGPRGFATTFVKGSYIELAYDDPTPTGFDIQPFAEETEISGPVAAINLIQRAGPPGNDGAAVLSPGDYGDPEFGQVLSVAPGATDLELTWPKRTAQYLSTSISSAPNGSTGEFTMQQFDVAAGVINFDWRPSFRGSAVTNGAGGTGGAGTDLRVDLIVVRDVEVGGDIVARGRGLAGQKTYQPNIISKVESGTNLVTAGSAVTFYVRTKKISGSATYGAAGSDAAFEMLVISA
jgi:hypothetical protein